MTSEETIKKMQQEMSELQVEIDKNKNILSHLRRELDFYESGKFCNTCEMHKALNIYKRRREG